MTQKDDRSDEELKARYAQLEAANKAAPNDVEIIREWCAVGDELRARGAL
jgi:hypothetical protein